MDIDTKVLDRIKGGLYGVAIGDALGGTTEFMSSREIQARHGYLNQIVGGGVWMLAPGEVTDDTAMTICVAEGLLEQPDDPMEAIGRHFLKWYDSDPKDIGNIIRRVFYHYRGNWLEASFSTHEESGGMSAGNGSLMRCLPVALAYPDRGRMESITRLQSKMTHYDDRCSDACLIYNRIAFRLLLGEELKAAIRDELKGTEYEHWVTELLQCEPSGFVVHTFRWALHFLLQSSSFSEVVEKAANLGGDSDTIAAIAGGLAGLYAGYEQLPTRYSGVILIREQLDDISERLYALRRKELDRT